MYRLVIVLAIIGFGYFGTFIMVQFYGLFLDVLKNEKGDNDEFNHKV